MAVPLTTREFRTTVGLFTTGVTVMTVRNGDAIHGMTANAIASVSLDPLLVLVCVEREAVMHRLLERAGSFALTVLAADQEPLARRFSNPKRPPGAAQFAALACHEGPKTGAPLLAGGLAFIECRVTEAVKGGDHSVVLGEVISLDRAERGEPLIWFRGAYRSLTPVTTADPLRDGRAAGG